MDVKLDSLQCRNGNYNFVIVISNCIAATGISWCIQLISHVAQSEGVTGPNIGQFQNLM